MGGHAVVTHAQYLLFPPHSSIGTVIRRRVRGTWALLSFWFWGEGGVHRVCRRRA